MMDELYNSVAVFFRPVSFKFLTNKRWSKFPIKCGIQEHTAVEYNHNLTVFNCIP